MLTHELSEISFVLHPRDGVFANILHAAADLSCVVEKPWHALCPTQWWGSHYVKVFSLLQVTLTRFTDFSSKERNRGTACGFSMNNGRRRYLIISSSEHPSHRVSRTRSILSFEPLSAVQQPLS
ncbi:hypothetical protein HGRIS_005367 [Hohenbuehelia grisea]|uniref:Uncharacterized protein n=1 Tax=Hohenbuehelia grisea TaxID=104357 RepID=A0ABR3JEU4_9AGAR